MEIGRRTDDSAGIGRIVPDILRSFERKSPNNACKVPITVLGSAKTTQDNQINKKATVSLLFRAAALKQITLLDNLFFLDISNA